MRMKAAHTCRSFSAEAASRLWFVPASMLVLMLPRNGLLPYTDLFADLYGSFHGQEIPANAINALANATPVYSACNFRSKANCGMA